MPPDHVRDVLAEIFRRGGMKRAVRRAEAVLLWPQAVGPELAKFSEAKTLRDGVLIVEVADSETSMHLTMQRERFLAAYRDRLGVREVREIRFVAGRPSAPPVPEPPQPAPRPDPDELASLARALGDLDLPDELAGPALEAGRALLSLRARHASRGWRPCRFCGAMGPSADACEACRRYREEPRVVAASRDLALDPDAPTPNLSDTERAIARDLARASLENSVRELLPHVLADPELAAQLEHVARRLLALRLDLPQKAVADEHFDHLDARVVRALGRWRGRGSHQEDAE